MAKNHKRNHAGIFVSLFIAFIMITSVIGYMVGENSSQTTSRYKGIKFTMVSGKWQASIGGKNYLFSYLPQDIEGLNVSLPPGLIDAKQIDTTYDYNSSYAQAIASAIFEFSNIASQRSIYVMHGFTSGGYENFPVLTCQNSTQFVSVIYFKEGSNTGAFLQANCLILESADQNGFVVMADFLAYKILGIL